jgi:hypothetical protein
LLQALTLTSAEPVLILPPIFSCMPDTQLLPQHPLKHLGPAEALLEDPPLLLLLLLLSAVRADQV